MIMRLGFKHFNIGKREFCITAWRWLDFTPIYKYKKYGVLEETGKHAIRIMHFNVLPVIRYEYTRSTKALCLEWLFWKIEIDDETYQDMGCCNKQSN